MLLAACCLVYGGLSSILCHAKLLLIFVPSLVFYILLVISNFGAFSYKKSLASEKSLKKEFAMSVIYAIVLGDIKILPTDVQESVARAVTVTKTNNK